MEQASALSRMLKRKLSAWVCCGPLTEPWAVIVPGKSPAGLSPKKVGDGCLQARMLPSTSQR